MRGPVSGETIGFVDNQPLQGGITNAGAGWREVANVVRPAGPKAERAYGTDELVKTIEGVT